MAPRFFSKEWCEEVVRKANADEEYLHKTKGFTVKYMFVVTDTPDDTDVKVIWDYSDGKVTLALYEEKKKPSGFRIGEEHWDESITLMKNQASYDTLRKVRDGTMTGLAAIGTKLWKIEGDLVKGMRYQPYNALIAEVQAQTPCEY